MQNALDGRTVRRCFLTSSAVHGYQPYVLSRSGVGYDRLAVLFDTKMPAWVHRLATLWTARSSASDKLRTFAGQRPRLFTRHRQPCDVELLFFFTRAELLRDNYQQVV